MKRLSRRRVVKQSLFGLLSIGVGKSVLSSGICPTESSGDLGSYQKYCQPSSIAQQVNRTNLGAATADNVQGPFYRAGAPYRAKITPPLEPGTVLVVSGQVWGLDTRKPLAGAVIDIWQANSQGRYDNDDAQSPPAEGIFKNRARLMTDENGYYEYETIHPAPYQLSPGMWRPSHIHYWVRHPDYRELITQLYFRGDPYNETDRFIKPSLIIEVERRKSGNLGYEAGTFDIVLAPKEKTDQDSGIRVRISDSTFKI